MKEEMFKADSSSEGNHVLTLVQCPASLRLQSDRRHRSKTLSTAMIVPEDDEDLLYDGDGGSVSEKETSLHFHFRELPAKMGEVLMMRGRSFEDFFEPLRLEVSSAKEL